MVRGQGQQVAGGIRLLPIRDAHPGGDPLIQAEPALGVQQGTPAPGMGLGPGRHPGRKPGRDAMAELVGPLVVAIAPGQPRLIHQQVHRLRHAKDAEHGDETRLLDQALLHQEAGEEAGLFVQEGGPCLDEAGGLLAIVGQPARHELLEVGTLLGHPLEGEAHQGIGAAPERQGVVAADDAKAALVEGLPVDRVVDDVGLAAQGYVLHPLHQQAVRGRGGIVEQAEVRRHLLELAVDAQDQAADPVVVGAYVDVHEGIRQHPVQVDPEAFQLAIQRLVVQLPDERQQQVIEAPQPDRHASD
ncbi:hypothetical protein D3C84_568570 [compost metagenome]